MGENRNTPAKAPGKPGEGQASRQAGHQATSQAGRQAARQAGKQARRQADAIQGDLGQFLKPGKNPLCLAAYLGNKELTTQIYDRAAKIYERTNRRFIRS